MTQFSSKALTLIKVAGRAISLKRCLQRILLGGANIGIDQLESRQMLDAVNWTGGGGDNLWHNPANWININTGLPSVPTSNDDANIDLGASNPTIILNATSGNRSVRTLNSAEAISFQGGSLSIATTANSSANWTLQGGTIVGGSVTLSGSGALVLTSSGGTLDGVMINGPLDAATNVSARATVSNNLTLNGTLTLGNDSRLEFVGTQTLGGNGTVVFGPTGPNALWVRSSNTILTIGSGITVQGGNSSSRSGMIGSYFTSGDGNNVSLVLQGTINAGTANGNIQLVPTGNGTLTNTGTINGINGGRIEVAKLQPLAEDTLVNLASSSSIRVAGNLLATTTVLARFNLRGSVEFVGPGNATDPELLEVMSDDRGNLPVGFVNNFSLGRLVLSNNAYVRLVDFYDNVAAETSEVLYVDSLIVPSGSTLDLNGKRVIARTAQIGVGSLIGQEFLTIIPDNGSIVLGTPTSGTIELGQLDEWTFFARAGEVINTVVSTGINSNPIPASPTLNWAQVRLVAPDGTILASELSPSVGREARLIGVPIAVDGVYRIRINAPPAQSTSTGNYTIAVWNVTEDVATLNLNQLSIGSIETPFATDRWNFTGAAGQQIKFDLRGATSSSIAFSLRSPTNIELFSNITGDSNLLTFSETGQYVLTAVGVNGSTGQYSFRIDQTVVTDLTVGSPMTLANPGSDGAQLFRIALIASSPLLFRLDDSNNANRNELYVRFGQAPTRTEYDYRFDLAASADQSILIPNAQGVWYALVYGQSVATVSNITVEALASSVLIRSITPDRSATGSSSSITISGAGFRPGVQIELIDGLGVAVASASDVQINSFTSVSASLQLAGIAQGTYGVRIRTPDGSLDTLSTSFTVLPAGLGQLETRLIMPGNFGRHAIATIYVEYANIGNASMSAPLLRLQSADQDDSDRPILTLDQSRLSQGFWTSNLAEGFSHTIQILASGSSPGILAPGERIQVPVYYAGLLQPWNFSDNQVEMEIRVFDAANTDPIPWAQLQPELRPYSINDEAWGPIYGNIISNVGSDWGDFVQMLSDNAQFLSRLGQRVIDVGELWSFEVQQAIGFNPVQTLASAIDGSIATPGGDLSFGRSYGLAIDQRFSASLFGRGWSIPWLARLTVDADGAVNVFGAGGARRRFEPDTRTSNAYFSLYGDAGKLVRVSSEYEVREQDGSVTRFSTAGRMLWSQDSNGNRVTMGYVGTQLTSLLHSSGASLAIVYNQAGLISSITDSANRATTFEYDPSNQYLVSSTAWDGQVIQYTYNTSPSSPRQHALTSITSGGTTRTFQYDALGRLAATFVASNAERIEFSYDSAGRVMTTDASSGTTSFFYDQRGLLGSVVDPFGQVTIAEYGDDRRLRRIVDPIGQNQTFTWCSCGSMTSNTNELGNTTRFTYAYVGPNDTIRRMTSFTDANGNTTQYTYDNRGNLLSTIYPNGSIERVSGYDPVGNALSFINRRGQTLSYTYNAAGQISRQTFADNTFIDFTYDPRGNLLTATEPGNRVTTFQYDSGDRLTRVEYPTGRFLVFGYDAFGRRTSMTDQSGFVVNYAYDIAGRLERLTDASSTLFVQYTYDTSGRLARKDNGNGTFTTYAYDAAGQVLSIVNRAPASAGGGVNSRFDYTYDVLGRRISMTIVDGTWTYGYDATGQLTSAIFVPVNGSSIPAQNLQYVYDAVGNRIRTIENGVTKTYTTNNLNQYTQVGGDVLAYDADGNLVSRSGPSGNATYTYDQQSRLTRVVTPEGIWEYQYDAFGNRIASTLNGQRTEFLLDPTGLVDVVGEYASTGALVARYVHALGLTTREDGATNSRSFYDFDAIGSTAGITNGSGMIVNRYAYTPFGESQQRIELLSNPFEYVGQFGVQYEGNGLQFMRARYTLPDLGRFVQPDPLLIAAGDANINRLAFNNPVSLIDPSGLWVGTLVGAVAGFGIDVSVQVGSQLWAGKTIGEVNISWGQAGRGALWGAAIGSFGPSGALLGRGGTDAARYGYSAGVLNSGWLRNTVGISAGWSWFESGNRLAFRIGAQHFDRWAQWLVLPHVARFPQLWDAIFGGVAGFLSTSGTSTSTDPNHFIGPSGFGPQNFVRSNALLPYRIEFENYGPGSLNEDGSLVSADRWATAPAQRVVVTNNLSADLDLSTFRYTGFGWGDFTINLPTPSQSWQQVVTMSLNGRSFEIWFEAEIDYATRQLRMVFQSLDPLTFLPPDVLTGFLPPEDGTGRGKGFVTYTVAPNNGLPSGREIRNVALIQFDGQLFIATNQRDPLNPSLGTDLDKEALVTIDAGNPSSVVEQLPESVGPRFVVSWRGNDDPQGSGVARYSIFVSTNNGVFVPWLVNTPLTQAQYEGTRGNRYSFYSVAIDQTGNREDAPTVADTSTTVGGVIPEVESVLFNDSRETQRSMVTSLTVTFNTEVVLERDAIQVVIFSPVSNVPQKVDIKIAAVNRGSYKLTFRGTFTEFGSLVDGRYELRINRNGVRSIDGGFVMDENTQFGFHRLFGDSDGDADVDALDLFRARQAAGSVRGDSNYLWWFDSDRDGDIATDDLFAVRRRFGVRLR